MGGAKCRDWFSFDVALGMQIKQHPSMQLLLAKTLN